MSSYEIKHLNHLGLVAGFCQEIGLIDYINEQFPNQATDKPMSYGHCLQAMILNGLGFTSQTLYLQSEFFSDKPTEKLQFKNQKKKDYQTPTARWVFFYFTGIDTLSIDKQEPIIVNIEERHRIIIEALGSPYKVLYS